MILEPLALEKQANTGCTHFLDFTYTDFINSAYANGSGTITVVIPSVNSTGYVPQYTIIKPTCFLYVVTGFASSASTWTVSFGDSGSVARYIVATDVTTAAVTKTTALTVPYIITSSTVNVGLTFAWTGTAPAAPTAGELRVYFGMVGIAGLLLE